MNIVKWVESPFNSVERIMLGAMRRPASLDDLVMPNVDFCEDKENFYIISELPGMSDDEVKVTVDLNTLTISGQKERKEEKKERNYHRAECSFGAFTRSFSLPKNVKETAISGTFKDGLLELTLPKIGNDTPSMQEIPLNTTTTNGQPFAKSNGHIKSEGKAILA
jgi:HSP20 family protein